MFVPLVLTIGLLQAPLQDLIVTGQPTGPVHVKLGQKLVFSESANSSTGGSWKVIKDGKPHLKFLNITEKREKHKSPPMPGQGSTVLITFSTLKRGSAELKMVYGQQWLIAKGEKPWNQLGVKVIVD